MIPLKWGLKKKKGGTNELIYKTGVMDVENKILLTGDKVGKDKLGDWDWHIHTNICIIDN